MPNCFSASSCCARAGTGKALAAARVAAAANVLMFFDMGAPPNEVVAADPRGIAARSHKRDTGFLWEPCATLPAEKPMPDRTLTFGRYRIEPRGGLMSGAREVHLTPKALALQSFLAERPGEVITKAELFSAVWPETSVGDAALVTCIQELRKALEDDARQPRYIETLHRRGYRFIGKPSPVSGQGDVKASALALPDKPSIAVLPF